MIARLWVLFSYSTFNHWIIVKCEWTDWFTTWSIAMTLMLTRCCKLLSASGFALVGPSNFALKISYGIRSHVRFTHKQNIIIQSSIFIYQLQNFCLNVRCYSCGNGHKSNKMGIYLSSWLNVLKSVYNGVCICARIIFDWVKNNSSYFCIGCPKFEGYHC